MRATDEENPELDARSRRHEEGGDGPDLGSLDSGDLISADDHGDHVLSGGDLDGLGDVGQATDLDSEDGDDATDMTLETLWTTVEFPYEGDIWAVHAGGQGKLLVLMQPPGDQASKLIHFDGQAWTVVYDGSETFLYDLWGANASDVWAVGGKSGPWEGWKSLILHFDGTAWTEIEQPQEMQPAFAMQVAGSSAGEAVYVVAAKLCAMQCHELQKFHDGVWEKVAVSPPLGFGDLWVADLDDAFLVGRYMDATTVLRWNGSELVPVELPTDGGLDLLGIWGLDSSDVIAVGDQGTVLRYDGEQWKQEPTGVDASLVAVWGAAPDFILAVGEEGTVLRFNGTAWVQEVALTTETLRDVHGTGPSGAIVVGDSGTVLRLALE